MRADVLVAEIGSTTTVVNAFDITGHPRFIGQGQAPTSVIEGDVRIGLQSAIDSLCRSIGVQSLEYGEMLATSSAAGGLKMTVHGLIHDMTAKAAREAALGAGAIVKMTTSGKLRRSDIAAIGDIGPNLILIAGGTDYGERDTAIHNAGLLAAAGFDAPVIYAGNIENQREVQLIFAQHGKDIYIAENVYPKLDLLNIEPARKIIHAVFEEHIVKAPGMEHVRDMVTGSIIPTPGAVMECALMLFKEIGDLIVFDVGGATTDIHSVTEGSEEINSILISPEPVAKRTVEGDLGVFVNARNVLELCDSAQLSAAMRAAPETVLAGYNAIPKTEDEFTLVSLLTETAAKTALTRHSGRLRHVFTPSGRKTLAEGKDLTQVRWLVATGGALTRLPRREQIMDSLAAINKSGMMLFPTAGRANLLYDSHYIMASLGALGKKYPAAATRLLLESLGINSQS